jgi:hypothetical protein
VQRRHWRDWLPLHDAGQYVFLDECGVTTDLLRRYGRSPLSRKPGRNNTLKTASARNRYQQSRRGRAEGWID